MPYTQLPSIFYHYEKQSSDDYQQQISGNVDLHRFVTGNPKPWIKPSPAMVKKPKILIISDWTLNGYSAEKRTHVCDILEQLISDGFQVGLLREHDIKPLTKPIKLPHKIHHIPNSLDAIGQQAITQYKRTADNIHVLDDYWINYLLQSQNKPMERVISTKEFAAIATTHGITDNIIALLKQSKPEVASILDDEYSLTITPIQALLRKEFPKAQQRYQPRYVSLNDTSLRDIALTATEVREITSLRICLVEEEPSSDAIDISVLLLGTENLEELYIDDGYGGLSLDAAGDTVINVSKLHALTCHHEGGDVFKTNLFKLLLSGPPAPLKKLSVNHDSMMYLMKHYPQSLSQIENIRVMTDEQEPDYSYTMIPKLVTIVPLLKMLTLENVTYRSAWKDSIPVNHNIKTLNIISSTIPHKNIYKFLKKTPNLSTLFISSAYNMDKLNHSEIVILPMLKTITIEYSDVDSKTLFQYISSATNLNNLTINDSYNCVNYHIDWDVFFTLNPPMSTIKKISISRANLNQKNLLNLLSKSSQLTSLKITQLYDLSETTEMADIPPLKLEKLTIEKCYIDIKLIDKILKKCSHIKRLNLINISITNNHNKLTITSKSLLQLTYLHITHEVLWEKYLITLLKAAPNITTLLLNKYYQNRLSNNAELTALIHRIPNVIWIDEPSDDEHLDNDAEPIPPTHDPIVHKDYIPTPKEQRFQYRGTNNTQNQAMLVEKISQYMQLTQKHTDLIPTIRDGICTQLSFYFLADPIEVKTLLRNAVDWDGDIETLTLGLRASFDALITYLIAHPHQEKDNYFLGDNLKAFINHSDRSYLLQNPWHMIAIQYHNGQYTIYDPNHIKGPQQIKKKKLPSTITKFIGHIISEVAEKQTLIDVPVLISKPHLFIKNGGLFALISSKNTQGIIGQLQTKKHKFNREILDGLLLRDNDGNPAWINGIINQSTRELFCDLLHEFVNKNYSKSGMLLQNSIDFVSQETIKKTLKHLRFHLKKLEFRRKPTWYLKGVAYLLENDIETEKYRQKLTTWIPTESNTQDLATYCKMHINHPRAKKSLIQCRSTEDSDALLLALQAYCRDTHRSYISINSPDDLVCSAPFINNEGMLKEGPGGPLHDALTQQRSGNQQPLVFLVNYKKFKHDDIVQASSLCDTEPRADGTLLPKNSIIIGLLPVNTPNLYQGADFYSRFDVVESCPINTETLETARPTLPLLAKEDATDEPFRINLYHAQNWKSRLLGHWTISGTRFVFEKGELQKAKEHGATVIEIQNGLWDDYDFELFWQDFFQNIPDAELALSPPFRPQLIRTEGYDWENLRKYIEPMPMSIVYEPWLALNPECLRDFYCNYDITETQQLVKLEGIIQEAKSRKKSTLPIFLTRALNSDDWAMLLSECQSHHDDESAVTLQLSCAPSVALPNELLDKANMVWFQSTHNTGLIHSNDPDTVVLGYPEHTVIDISECTGPDLLTYRTGKFNPATLVMTFEKKEGALLTLLAMGKKVILKGKFSTELSDALTPLLLKRLQAPMTTQGELLLLSEDISAFGYQPYLNIPVMEAEKQYYLGIEPMAPSPLPFTTESLTQLITRKKAMTSHPEGNGSNAWDGFYNVPLDAMALNELDTTHSETETREFNEQRLLNVNTVLKREPYVFLAGLSGVGKSTFVTKHLCPNPALLYHGVTTMENWAKHSPLTDEYITLFIDEANLDPSDWSLFEGLFQKNPHIIINGTFYYVSPQHKVVFAGNPLSYGDERKVASLFQRHGNAVIFQPMTTAVIYEDILKPLFARTNLKDQSGDICHHILNIYRFFCAQSTNDVLISPRELEMMALLTIAHTNQHPDASPMDVARHFAFQLSYRLVPLSAQKEFEAIAKPPSEALKTSKSDTGTFFITPSRLKTQILFNELLSLREQRQATAAGTQPDVWFYGGLGGFVLEGEPGIGKSELIIHLLKARGYNEVINVSTPASDKNLFYRMPVSLSISAKKALLLKAFQEGAVVIVDELNSSPMIEQLLNELMMGFYQNKRPNVPGFMVEKWVKKFGPKFEEVKI